MEILYSITFFRTGFSCTSFCYKHNLILHQMAEGKKNQERCTTDGNGLRKNFIKSSFFSSLKALHYYVQMISYKQQKKLIAIAGRKGKSMRAVLKTGTIIRVPGGVLYKVISEPIGEGGGSIIYPVLRFLPDKKSSYIKSSILYALKECFPVSSRYTFSRSETGEIIPSQDEPSAVQYLTRAKNMQLFENNITGEIYHTGFRLTPVLESFQEIEISQDNGQTYQKVFNCISVMESLSEKGMSLKTYLKGRKHLPADQTSRIIEQVLYAVREVHEAGYLHLDLQDGNIFLKGILEDGSGMISLIDFGSSRKRLEDGLCQEIKDRVLYSTPGYSAPEILSGNDGTLRLAPSADIYSIGYLMLLLLTGHRFSAKELSANKTGRYIPRFSIRKTRCPKHLTGRMQDILAKALADCPEDRYADAGDMLKDISAFSAMLMPYISPLSAAKYDAFICYRHSALDTPAARALRNSLERFKGGQFFGSHPIKKVFLDEGELSSCADFGERIRDALKNSEWLIIVCSKETKESIWVDNEIQVFFEYHDTSHILTVVTEGEPKEVFPKALIQCGMDDTHLLAADARGRNIKQTLKKIRSDVTLKIAAPILHTTFDALKQRNKLYIMKRTFILICICLTVISVFLGYAAIKSNEIAAQAVKISREHKTALKGQALYLSGQAQKSYEAHDPVLAMEQACQACDLLKTDNLFLPELIDLLSKTMELYALPSDAAESMTVAGRFTLDENNAFDEYFTDNKGNTLFTADASHIYMWDTTSFQCTGSIAVPEPIQKFDENLLISQKEQYLLVMENKISCYDYRHKADLWSHEFPEGIIEVKVSHDETIVAVLTRHTLYILDTDGTVLDSSPLPSVSESSLKDKTLSISPDNKWIAFINTQQDTDDSLYLFETVLYDIAGQKYKVISSFKSEEPLTFTQHSIFFTSDNKLFTVYGTGLDTIYVTNVYKYNSERKHLSIGLYDPDKKQTLWETKRSFVSLHDDFLTLDTIYKGAPAILFIYGNTCDIFKSSDGKLLESYETNAPVIQAWSEKDRDVLILENGHLVYHEHDTSSLTGYEYFPAETAVCHRNGTDYYIRKRKDRSFLQEASIIKYQKGTADSRYERCAYLEMESEAEKYLPDGLEYLSSDTEAVSQNKQYYAHIKEDSIIVENKKTKKEQLLRTEKKPSGLLCIPDSDELLICFTDRSGYVVNMSEDSFGIMYELEDFYAYDSSEDVFYFLSNTYSMEQLNEGIFIEKTELGKIKRYSTDEIIQMAKNKIK